MSEPLKAPFPAFGGKKKVAALTWDRLGDVPNFIEPFANSAAVLLARPHAGRIETINDANHYVANFWRALKHDPEAVVDFADWPVNEADLHARHKWLVGIGPSAHPAADFAARMKVEPDLYDARVAGWWAWGACCWIGSGWCESISEQLPILLGSYGINGLSQKLPDISGHANGSGRGVHQASGPSQPREQMPSLRGDDCSTHAGTGIHRKAPSDFHRPQLADAYARGRGVHSNDSAGTVAQRRAWLLDWFGRLSDRLRTVRVCCGDWKRVCDSDSVTTRIGETGIFLDAPYKTHLDDGTASRAGGLYANDREQDVNALVDDVIAYCVERGARPGYRIAACCYEGEGYEVLRALGWEEVEWKASGGYANRTGKNDNAARERIWFSPGCKSGRPGRNHHPLFAAKEAS